MAENPFLVITAVKVFWRSNDGVVRAGECMGRRERDRPPKGGNSRIALVCILGNEFRCQFPFLPLAYVEFRKTSSTRADDNRVSDNICGQMIIVSAFFDTNQLDFLSCSLTCRREQENEQQADDDKPYDFHECPLSIGASFSICPVRSWAVRIPRSIRVVLTDSLLIPFPNMSLYLQCINSVNLVSPMRGNKISIALTFRSLDSRLPGLV